MAHLYEPQTVQQFGARETHAAKMMADVMKQSTAETPTSGDQKLSFAEIAEQFDLNQNTVRAHFANYADVLRPEKTTGSRGKRIIGAETVRKYELFLLLKGDDVRLTASEAINIIRNGYAGRLYGIVERGIPELLVAVQEIRKELGAD